MSSCSRRCKRGRPILRAKIQRRDHCLASPLISSRAWGDARRWLCFRLAGRVDLVRSTPRPVRSPPLQPVPPTAPGSSRSRSAPSPTGTGDQPGHRDLHRFGFVPFRHLIQRLDARRTHSRSDISRPAHRGRGPSDIRFRTILSGQEPAGQRVISDDTDFFLQAQIFQRSLELRPLHQAVLRLQALIARQALRRC